MNADFIQGVVTPLITPVDAEERVSETGLRNQIEHVLRGGVHGVFIVGSTGEFYGLDYDEKKRATEITVDQVKGRVPVYVGASATRSSMCCAEACMAFLLSAAPANSMALTTTRRNERRKSPWTRSRDGVRVWARR